MNAFVYIAKDLRGVLHTDVTLSLNRTMWQHRFGDDQDVLQQPVFEALVFIERHSHLASAYRRRAELRRMSQPELEALARRRNPNLKDLSSLWFSPKLACVQMEENPSEVEQA
jgi:predicted GIY-YIG superfamily endonuclease